MKTDLDLKIWCKSTDFVIVESVLLQQVFNPTLFNCHPLYASYLIPCLQYSLSASHLSQRTSQLPATSSEQRRLSQPASGALFLSQISQPATKPASSNPLCLLYQPTSKPERVSQLPPSLSTSQPPSLSASYLCQRASQPGSHRYSRPATVSQPASKSAAVSFNQPAAFFVMI